MMRFLIVVAGFALASIIQLSFFSAMPEPLSFTPFLLVVCVYMIQRFGMTTMGWWLVFQGIILDVYHLSFISFESLCYTVAAIVAVFSSQSLFSNRSFYGVLGATITTILCLSVCELLIILLQALFHTSQIQLSVFFAFVFWRLLLGVFFLFVLYSFGKKTLNLDRFFDFRSKFSS